MCVLLLSHPFPSPSEVTTTLSTEFFLSFTRLFVSLTGVLFRVVCSEPYVHRIILTVCSFLTVVYVCNSFISIDVYVVFHCITVCACVLIDICGGNQIFVCLFGFFLRG